MKRYRKRIIHRTFLSQLYISYLYKLLTWAIRISPLFRSVSTRMGHPILDHKTSVEVWVYISHKKARSPMDHCITPSSTYRRIESPDGMPAQSASFPSRNKW